jgi:hypothetical protein
VSEVAKDIVERASELVSKHAKELPQEIIKLIFEMSHEIAALKREAERPVIKVNETTDSSQPFISPPIENWPKPGPREPMIVMYGASPSFPEGHGGGFGVTTAITSDKTEGNK